LLLSHIHIKIYTIKEANLVSAAERDFSNFYLGDNVYELADGLILEVAERLDVELGAEPNSADLWDLVGKIGPNKVLRQNEELEAIDRETAVDLVERSGVQASLNRSLWTPQQPAIHEKLWIPGTGEDREPFFPEPQTGIHVDALVSTGSVANWYDRTTGLLHRPPAYVKVPFRTDASEPTTPEQSNTTSSNPFHDLPQYVAAGNRVMDTATEVGNVHIKAIRQRFGRYPTEAEYAGMRSRGALVTGYPMAKADELAAMFFEDNPHLLEESLAFVRVANAGVQLAVQFRKAAQARSPQFDADPAKPQVFILTDTFPLARTEAQESKPAQYQKATTALRQVALTAKMLHEASGGE
jgi:hypothetical protein